MTGEKVFTRSVQTPSYASLGSTIFSVQGWLNPRRPRAGCSKSINPTKKKVTDNPSVAKHLRLLRALGSQLVVEQGSAGPFSVTHGKLGGHSSVRVPVCLKDVGIFLP